MIAVRQGAELTKIRKACKIVAECLEMARPLVVVGATTMSINTAIERFITSHDAYPTFKGYHGFPFASCISINNVVVHGMPSERVLVEGDIVSIDIGATLNGYNGDAARTFPVGAVTPLAQKLIDTARESFDKAIDILRAGKRVGDIGHAVQSYVESRGFGVVRQMVGHGIGRKLHEEPQIPNFGSPNTGPLLAAGNVLAIEPMITAGGYAIKIDPVDKWTCSTTDGSLSAHYENTVLITDNSAEILTVI